MRNALTYNGSKGSPNTASIMAIAYVLQSQIAISTETYQLHQFKELLRDNRHGKEEESSSEMQTTNEIFVVNLFLRLLYYFKGFLKHLPTLAHVKGTFELAIASKLENGQHVQSVTKDNTAVQVEISQLILARNIDAWWCCAFLVMLRRVLLLFFGLSYCTFKLFSDSCFAALRRVTAISVSLVSAVINDLKNATCRHN